MGVLSSDPRHPRKAGHDGVCYKDGGERSILEACLPPSLAKGLTPAAL